MKIIFTLAGVVLFAMNVNAQDVYNAIVDGKLATEFAVVAGESGGIANNSVNGKSIITMTAGKATVTAVGGTTPATADGGGQQITPGAVIDAEKHIYETASVEAWNDINWGLKYQGDIDFWYVTGTGNPYVKMNAVENSKDGDWLGTYKADYVYYNPDGSLGMPITGLYYKFTASAAGAFRVKVWANKGNRQTFVVNANTKKAERLYASGYINGVNDAEGKKKLLTVEQVDSVHNVYIWGNYNNLVKQNEDAAAAGQELPNSEEKLAAAKEEAEKNAIDRQYVIGNGGQNFWGWLTFDVEAGEEYWVFQHSSQIGFGGFEFHEGMTADELINSIESPYVYTTDFSTYEDDATGERVTWKGEKAVGNGQFVSTEEEGAVFGDYFQNDGTAVRTSYCLLPEDVLAHSAKTHELTIAFWVSAEGFTPDQYTYAPMFTAYAQNNTSNTWPLLALQSRGFAQVNCDGWCDFTGANNANGKNTVYNSNAWEATDKNPAGELTHINGGNWLEDQKWHYYTAVFTDTNVKIFMDGEVKNEWNIDGVTEGQIVSGLFDHGADLKYVCLGGNQAWDWNDNDSPFRFACLLIKNTNMTQGEIKAQMTADFPGWEKYLGENSLTGDANGDGSVNVTDYLAIANYILGSNTANFDVAAADVNGDNDINVSDYVGVANIILYANWQGSSVNGSRALGAEETSPWMEIGLSEDGKMNLLLRNTKPFSAFQMDIRLPEGMEIADANMAKANQTKSLGYRRLQDGTWRLLYGTLENKTVNLGGDHLLTLELASSNSHIGGLVTVDNIFLANRDASAVRLKAVQSGLPTGIYSIESGASISGDCYDLTGRKVDNSQLKKGVYIVNGKKIFVK